MDDEEFERIKASIIEQRARSEIKSAKAPKRSDRTDVLNRKIDRQIHKTNERISRLKDALLNLASSSKNNQKALKDLKRSGKQTDARLRKTAKRVKALNESHNKHKN